MYLDPLDSNSPLPLQLRRIPLMALLLAVLQPRAVMALQQPMLRAVLARAEAALAHYGLDLLLALVRGVVLLVVALGEFGRHAAANGESEMEGGLVSDVGFLEGCCGGEVPAGEDEAEVGLREVCSQGEELAECGD